jgi:hypothetical protein
MKWREWFGEHTLFVMSVAVLLAAPVLAWSSGGNPTDAQTAVLLATAVVLLHYTYETYRMRREMAHQNQLAVLPLVLATVRRVGPDLRVILRNIGRGPAVFVRVDDFSVHELEGGGGFSLRIRPVDCIEGAAEEVLDVQQIAREADGTESSHSWYFAAVLFPATANKSYVITARYEDINHGQHWSKTQMGKGGIWLLEHGRA